MGIEDISEAKNFSSKSASLLKTERGLRGWSQDDVAKKIGTTRLNISRWENGRTFPTPYYRQKLGELFGKSLLDLGLFSDGSAGYHENAAAFSQASSSALPIWNMPYRRNPFFTGRETLLAYLYNAFRNKKVISLTQALAISGLGGIGKTQIAIEYAYRYHKHYKAVLWINAGSYEVSVADFVALAALLNLPEQHEPDQHIVIGAVKRWLDTHPKWLLILDNVDKLGTIAGYLPRNKIGDILITTRLQALGTVAHSIEVGNMGLDESVKFLLRRAKLLAPGASFKHIAKETLAQAVEIVTGLNGLPLALDQAGAYIEETRCGLSQFASLFVTRRKELLMRRGSFPLEHPDSVVATWSLSFQQVEHENQGAADLLRLLAFLNPEYIPEEIITLGAAELGPTLGPAVHDSIRFDELIGLLLRFSLIRRNSEVKCLSIHRLVQAVLIDDMKKDAHHLWAERAIRAVYKAFTYTKLKTWEQCQRYLPQIVVCARHLDDYQLIFPESAQLLNDLAEYLLEHGHYEQVEWLLQKALVVRQQTLEADHPDIARTLNNLGDYFRISGEYVFAEEYYNKALHIQERVFGLEHPDIARTYLALAILYRSRGLYLQSEPFFLRAIHIRETALGADHPLVAQSYYNLARLYHRLERYELAEELGKRALDALESSFEENAHLITSTLIVLAKISLAQNKLDQAEEMSKRALAIRENTSGAHHPQIANILNDLIEIYLVQGKYREAEPLNDKSLRIHEQSLGPEHPYLAYGLSNRAKSFFLQGNIEQAEIYYRKALVIRERSLGTNHPHTASTYEELARIYSNLERYEEAESLFLKVLAIRERAFGADHPAVARILEQRATLLRKLKRETEAFELETRIQLIRTRSVTLESL